MTRAIQVAFTGLGTHLGRPTACDRLSVFDLSIFAFIGVYLLSVVDAYVDAELSNFDIGPDLSMHVEPAVIDNSQVKFKPDNNRAVGLQCSFRF